MTGITSRLVMLALLALTPIAALAQSHDIRLNRPVTVGSRYLLSSEAKEERTVSGRLGDDVQPEQTGSYSATLEAEVEVVAIDDKGMAKNVRFHIRSLKIQTETGEKQPFIGGAIILGEMKNRRMVFSVADGQLPERFQSLFELLMEFPSGDADYDAFYGSSQPRAIGDQWPVNAAEVVSYLAGDKITIKPEDVVGTVKLAGRVEERGVPCLELRCEMTMSNMSVPEGAVPSTVQVVQNEAGGTITWLMPLDAGLPIARVETKGTQRTVMKGYVGQDLKRYESSLVNTRHSIKRLSPM